MGLPHLECNSIRDIHSTKSAMPKPRDFLKSYDQELPSHGETGSAAKRTEQIKSRYSKDDSWLSQLAMKEELNQLHHKLQGPKTTLEKNEAELQNLSGDQDKILAQQKDLIDLVKQKEAQMLKDNLDKFQKNLKFPEEGLLDIDPLKENLKKSEKFLQYLSSKGANTRKLEVFLQKIDICVKSTEDLIDSRKKTREIIHEYNLDVKNKKITLDDKYTEENYRDDYDKLWAVANEFANGIKNRSKNSSLPSDLGEKASICLSLGYKICEHRISLSSKAFKAFLKESQDIVEDQIHKISKNTLSIPTKATDTRSTH